MESLALIKYPEKFKDTLHNMLLRINSEEFPKNDNLAALGFLYSYNNRFNMYFLQGNSNKVVSVIPE